MFSTEQLNSLAKAVMSRLSSKQDTNSDGKKADSNKTFSKVAITPSQALVIAGILGGVLEVDSVLVDKDQTVQIILEGSLKRKTELEEMMDKIGEMPFDEVLKAMLGRL